MKKVFYLLLCMMPFMLIAEVSITYQFANQSITHESGKSYLDFDITAHASETDTKLGTGIVYFYYNTNAFGVGVFGNNKIDVNKGSLTTTPEDWPTGFVQYDLVLNDSFPDVLAITFYLKNTNMGKPVLTTPSTLVHVRLEIADTSQNAGLSFWTENMQHETYFDDQSNVYNPVIASDTYNDTLPVELSSFTAQTSIDNFVNLMWVTQTETGVQGFYVFRGASDILNNALQISPLIPATNTSQMQCYVYKDTELYEEGRYYYWLQNADLDGTSQFHGPIIFDYAPVGNFAPELPLKTGLQSLYPNPFNPDLRIAYSLEKREPVLLQVYNLKGQLIGTLVDGYKDSGNHTCVWNALDLDGRRCSSGMYLVKMTVGSRTYTNKVVLMK